MYTFTLNFANILSISLYPLCAFNNPFVSLQIVHYELIILSIVNSTFQSCVIISGLTRSIFDFKLSILILFSPELIIIYKLFSQRLLYKLICFYLV